MEILRAAQADIVVLASVEIASKRASIPDLIDPVEVDPAGRQRRWQTYLRGETPEGSRPERQVLMASVEGTVVGFIAGHLTSRHGMDAEIQSLFVLIEHQRRGIASGLLAAMAPWFLEMGAHRVCVGVNSRSPYNAFYLKHGARHLNEHWLYWAEARDLGTRAQGTRPGPDK